MSQCKPRLTKNLLIKNMLGFAYLWLLFVVAFMGLGLSVGAELYVTAQQREKERELLAVGRQFRQAIGRYYETQVVSNTTSQGQYPANLDDLLQDPRSLSTKRHLRKIFIDPMTGKAEWGLYKSGGRVIGVFSLSEKTSIKQDGFDFDDLGFRGKMKHSDWVFAYPADVLERLEPSGGLTVPTAINPIVSLPQTSPSPAKPNPDSSVTIK
jgi:type II secretory pathway pseudopilin PulG